MRDLISDGFRLPEDDRPAVLGFMSLKIALQSYLSTYEAMKNHLRIFDESLELEQETIDAKHPMHAIDSLIWVTYPAQHANSLSSGMYRKFYLRDGCLKA